MSKKVQVAGITITFDNPALDFTTSESTQTVYLGHLFRDLGITLENCIEALGGLKPGPLVEAMRKFE